MKIKPSSLRWQIRPDALNAPQRNGLKKSHVSRPRDGSALLIILVLLMIMVVLAAANTTVLKNLRQRLKIVEQRQNQRLAVFSTNAAHIARPPISR
jgi:hypothetical protein